MFRCAVPCHAPAGVVCRPMGRAEPNQLPHGQTLVLQDSPGARAFFPVGGDPWVRGLEVSQGGVAANAAGASSSDGDSTANWPMVFEQHDVGDASSVSSSSNPIRLSGRHQYGTGALRHARFDPATGAVYFLQGVRPCAHRVQHVAGHCTQQGCADGQGDAARLISMHAIAPDGMGCVFVADGPHLRRVQLPDRPPSCADAARNAAHATPCNTAALAAGRADATCTTHGSAPDTWCLVEAASSFVAPAAQVTAAASGSAAVTTLLTAPASITGIAFVPQTGALLLATATAVCRARPPSLPLQPSSCYSPAAARMCNSTCDATTYSVGQTGASARCTGCCMEGREAPVTQVLLVAGYEGASGVQADAERGQEARFNNIRGLAADDRCNAYVLDWRPGGTGTCATRVRAVGAEGRVSSLGPDLPCFAHDPCVLPCLGGDHGGGGGGGMGCLAACSSSTGQLWLVALPALQSALPVVAAPEQQQALTADCSGGVLMGRAGPCGRHRGWGQGQEHCLAADLEVLLSGPASVRQRWQRQQHGQQACYAPGSHRLTQPQEQQPQEHPDQQHDQQSTLPHCGCSQLAAPLPLRAPAAPAPLQAPPPFPTCPRKAPTTCPPLAPAYRILPQTSPSTWQGSPSTPTAPSSPPAPSTSVNACPPPGSTPHPPPPRPTPYPPPSPTSPRPHLASSTTRSTPCPAPSVACNHLQQQTSSLYTWTCPMRTPTPSPLCFCTCTQTGWPCPHICCAPPWSWQTGCCCPAACGGYGGGWRAPRGTTRWRATCGGRRQVGVWGWPVAWRKPTGSSTRTRGLTDIDHVKRSRPGKCC